MMIENGVTIEEILKMDCMSHSKIIAGHGGIKNIINQVNVMADPDVLSWVDQGDLLLTTAYSFNNENVEEQTNLIEECAKRNLAGIGIKIYPYITSLPDEVIDIANKLNFPIIDLHYATAFSDIMTQIFKEIFTRQASVLQKIESIHKQMTNAILMGASVEDMTNVIFDHLKNPIYVKLDFPEKSIFKSSVDDECLKDELISNANLFKNELVITNKENNIYESNETINGKIVSRAVMPITIKNNIYGNIFAYGINSKIAGVDISVLESASTTIALEVMKKLSIKEVENKYKAEFLDDLLSNEDRRKEKALERAGYFNIKKEDKSQIILITMSDMGDSSKNSLIEKNSQEEISKIVHFIEKIAKDMGVNVVLAGKTESILLLLSFKKGSSIDQSLDPFIDAIKNTFEKRIGNLNFKMGIGRSYENLINAYKSYKDALEAIASGDILGEGNIVYFENLGIYKILCQENLREEIQKFYKINLAPLVQYDNRKSTELVKTLEAYFEYNGNLKKMSDALFTHYNTILYRISRIKEITGINLENAKDRLNLEIALKIKKILEK